MIDQLEADVREALSEHVAELPAQAAVRVRSVDYYSRARTRRMALAAGTLVATAGAVVVTLSVIGLGTGAGTQAAYAGWSASPTQPRPGQIASAEATCQGQALARPGTSPTAWSPVLTDTRGPFTMMILQNKSDFFSCFPEGSAIGGGEGAVPASPSPGQLSVVGVANAPADPYTLIYGRVGPGLSGVTLVLEDGTKVQSTVSDGWFAAWWPGQEQAHTMELSTEHGITTLPLRTMWN